MIGEFNYGTGRRKTAVARVFIKKGKGDIIVNGKPLEQYFSRETGASSSPSADSIQRLQPRWGRGHAVRDALRGRTLHALPRAADPRGRQCFLGSQYVCA